MFSRPPSDAVFFCPVRPLPRPAIALPHAPSQIYLVFKANTDASNKSGFRRERELTAWASDTPSPAPGVTFGSHGDDVTFDSGASNCSWDQFAMNEKPFGLKASFDEAAYTKRDRSGPDLKEQEHKAQRIANEILGVSPIIPHMICSKVSAVCDKQCPRS